MNIVSTMVGITIMGAAAPSVLTMTLAPVEAQARALNFSKAETSAVAFSGQWEGEKSSSWGTNYPSNCEAPASTSLNGLAWDILCWGGKHTKRGDAKDSNYYQEVTRSFRLASSAAGTSFSWNQPVPDNIGAHQCHKGDSWGSNLPQGYNALYEDVTGACVPRVAWTQEKYLASDPEKWEYDLRGYADQEAYATHSAFLSEDDQ